MQSLPEAFNALAQYPQWIVWKASPKPGGGFNKYPVSPHTGEVVDAHDAQHWTGAAEAITAAQLFGPAYGAGFVVTAADPFFFIDIDNCLQGAAWSPRAVELCQRFAGAAVEVSHSGQALHIIGSGQPPAGPRKIKYGAEFDLYTEQRFIALTGTSATGDAGSDHTAALAQLVTDYLQRDATPHGEEWTTEADPIWQGPEDDDVLLGKMLRTGSAGAAFGADVAFSHLWHADADALGAKWPDDHGGRSFDASSADASLAQHLAFWTGRNCERMERLMRQSALAREKWDEREDYLARTITRAASLQETVYTGGTGKEDKAPSPPPEPAEPQETLPSQSQMTAGLQYLASTQQIEHFQGCVYVQDVHKVLTPRGTMLKPEQFKATYGGYVFTLDAEGSKTTRNAWEAFIDNQAVRHPKVTSSIFRPDLPPGEIIEAEGMTQVNNYCPVPVESYPGDVSPFLDHLARILPDQRDQAILLAYMAACVQHIGIKFQWTPLLQGCEGNGKTAFTRAVSYAVGMRHTHFPQANEIGNKFNSWVLGKVFIGVEDVYIPEHRREVIEALKPLITNNWLPVEPKGVDQTTAYVCANFMLNSNHKDAIRKTRTDRRFCVMYTAQQSDGDLQRAGMTGNYFPDLYHWYKKRGGHQMVAHYLQHYAIPDELNPAGSCHRAPVTSTTEQAIQMSLGGVEQEVQEAIEQGQTGFAGGWISSMALDRLLDTMRASRQIPPNKRRQLLQDLGYDWHPGLVNGRVHNPVMPDNGKPRLFIRDGHLAANLQKPAEIARAYTQAQTDAAAGTASPAEQTFGR